MTHQLRLMISVELALHNVTQEIEKLPADLRLTRAVQLLTEARKMVADYVDGVEHPQPAEEFGPEHTKHIVEHDNP